MIGEARDRVDGRAKVTGGARYAAEHNVDDVVHAVVVAATIPSGTIKSIDATAAKKAPGVMAVLSHLNAPKLKPPPAQSQGGGQPSGNFAEPHFIPFSDGTVHYVGQQIAVVLADTLEHATHGAELLKIAYDAAPARTDMNALRAEATEKGSQQAPPFTKGDPLGAFATAPVKVDHVYRTPYEHHNPIEAHSIVVAWDGDKVTLWDSSQNIFAVRQTLAQSFGIPRENVTVKSPFVGGAFGSKGSMWPHVLIGALAARVVKRPVKLWLPRKQLFFTNGHRPETEQRVALGATADGKLVSLIHEGISQGNKISDYNERFTRPTRTIYASPNIRASNKVVELNVSTPTYMRAPGENPGMFAIESAMDELAAALTMDPIQLRLVNHADADPTDGKPWSSKSLRECYTRGAEFFGWSKRTPEPRSMRDGRLLIGYGMASATYPSHRSPASARARMNADGTAVVQSGTHEMGMGTATVMAQLAAETLGLPFERVRFEYGSTELPQAPISAGSMTAASVGTAVFQAAAALKKKLAELGPGDDYAALLHAHYLPYVEVQVDAKPDPEEQKYSSHAFGAHFAEVSVDPDLGLVRLRRMVSAFAGGRILNAKTARSQYLGGIVQGIGMALLESTHYDKRFGSFTSINLGEYLMPVNADIRSIDVILVEEDDPHVNPIGAKGIGEIGIVGVAPAIANAVYHATGKRIRDLPITCDKLL
ncbi:MAG TPA: xanthine dehydrogenase family protein molybdopterin-binding subunit [Thermoanaerobaculia bacterium]|jgi:xanthine dehydrogenase YagR molybdenum-binding subunit